ncbi:MAG TPA: hypothetical protein VFE83_09085 [Lysobacter sp.]|nr:hypothetical protein [Lysobacter sp.]
MNLTPPSFPLFFISVIFGGAGLAARFGYLPELAPFAFSLVAFGFIMLVLGSLFRRL